MSSGQRIVILLPNWVGDVVMATPALDALCRCFGDAHIACLGRPIALEVLQPAEWVDEWIVDESDRANRALGFLRLAGKIRSSHYDLAVLFPNSFRAALLARVGGVRRIAGYDRDGRGWMLTDKLAPARDEKHRFIPVPAIDYYLGLAGLLGAGGESRRMFLPVSESSQAEAESILQQAAFGPGKPLVMLNPGASFGVSKMWDPDRYAAVADALIEKRGAQIIINAAPLERPVAAQVAAAMQHTPLVNFAQRDNTIGLLKSLMRRCDLLITNDTGARHIAAAFGIGVVTVFGSTDPRWTEIYYDHQRIVRVDVPCAPCQQKLCPNPAGPLYHRCMSAITPQMVLAAADQLLDNPGEPLQENVQ